MKATVSKQTLVTLTLTEEEAKWLKYVIKEAVDGDDMAATAEEEDIRRDFWDALDDIVL